MTDDALDEPGMSAEAFAVSDGAYALLVADFSDSAAALQAYEELHGLEDGLHIKIEAVVVVKRDSDGAVDVEKTSDHSTVRGLGWGVAGGMLLESSFRRRSSAARSWREPRVREPASSSSVITTRSWRKNWRT